MPRKTLIIKTRNLCSINAMAVLRTVSHINGYFLVIMTFIWYNQFYVVTMNYWPYELLYYFTNLLLLRITVSLIIT